MSQWKSVRRFGRNASLFSVMDLNATVNVQRAIQSGLNFLDQRRQFLIEISSHRATLPDKNSRTNSRGG